MFSLIFCRLSQLESSVQTNTKVRLAGMSGGRFLNSFLIFFRTELRFQCVPSGLK